MICMFSIYAVLILMVLVGLISIIFGNFWTIQNHYSTIIIFTIAMLGYILVFPIILSIFNKMICGV